MLFHPMYSDSSATELLMPTSHDAGQSVGGCKSPRQPPHQQRLSNGNDQQRVQPSLVATTEWLWVGVRHEYHVQRPYLHRQTLHNSHTHHTPPPVWWCPAVSHSEYMHFLHHPFLTAAIYCVVIQNWNQDSSKGIAMHQKKLLVDASDW